MNLKKILSICLLGCAAGSVSLVKAERKSVKKFTLGRDSQIIETYSQTEPKSSGASDSLSNRTVGEIKGIHKDTSSPYTNPTIINILSNPLTEISSDYYTPYISPTIETFDIDRFAKFLGVNIS